MTLSYNLQLLNYPFALSDDVDLSDDSFYVDLWLFILEKLLETTSRCQIDRTLSSLIEFTKLLGFDFEKAKSRADFLSDLAAFAHQCNTESTSSHNDVPFLHALCSNAQSLFSTTPSFLPPDVRASLKSIKTTPLSLNQLDERLTEVKGVSADLVIRINGRTPSKLASAEQFSKLGELILKLSNELNSFCQFVKSLLTNTKRHKPSNYDSEVINFFNEAFQEFKKLFEIQELLMELKGSIEMVGSTSFIESSSIFNQLNYKLYEEVAQLLQKEIN
ncbi:hypothetical protein P9112_003073 [Eukaryota sp. TZLM1-RC]